MDKPESMSGKRWDAFALRVLPNHFLFHSPFVYTTQRPDLTAENWCVACDGRVLVAQSLYTTSGIGISQDEIIGVFRAAGRSFPRLDPPMDARRVDLDVVAEWCRVGTADCPGCGGEGFCYTSEVPGAVEVHLGVLRLDSEDLAVDRRIVEWAILPFLDETTAWCGRTQDMLHVSGATWRAILPLARVDPSYLSASPRLDV